MTAVYHALDGQPGRVIQRLAGAIGQAAHRGSVTLELRANARPATIPASMVPAEPVLEIPRGLAAHIYKLLGGLALLGIAALAVTARPSDWPAGLLISSPFAVAGLLLAAGNAAVILRRRAPQLRATRAGLWFGAGALVPWHDVAAIYEAGIPIERYGFSVKTRAINIRFGRKRTLLRVPSSLWLTTFALDTVKISLFASSDQPAAVVVRLEVLRLAAVGHEDGVLAGAGEVPAARVVQR
jgi:hypothetical protein